MKNKKKKLLIVGGSGFLGYHLSKICIKKYDITSLSLSKPIKERKINKVKYIICDISKKKNLEKKIKHNYEIVVNLGGYIDHQNILRTKNSHFIGCKNLVNFFKKREIKIFIQIGSSSEYGKINSPHKENLSGKPSTIYGKSKLMASKYLFKFAKKYEFPFTIIRFYQVYGPKQNNDRMIPYVINSSLKNINFNCSSGVQNRDFLFVDDAVKAILKCFNNKSVIGKIFNIGSGRSSNIKKVIMLLNKTIKSGTPLFGAVKMRADEPINSYPDLRNSKKYLNWKSKITLKKGLERTILFYKKKLKV